MEKIIYHFRAVDPTPALKEHAESALIDLIGLLPESAHFRWILDFDRKRHEGLAELTLQGHRDTPLVVKESNPDLYQAMSDAAKRLKHLVLARREARRVQRHEGGGLPENP